MTREMVDTGEKLIEEEESLHQLILRKLKDLSWKNPQSFCNQLMGWIEELRTFLMSWSTKDWRSHRLDYILPAPTYTLVTTEFHGS